VTGRGQVVLLLLAGLVGCGVKAPPRAAGSPDQAPPADLFRPMDDPDKPGVDFIKSSQETVQPPAAPAAPAVPGVPAGTAAPAVPATPAAEPSR
jgi:hypothetical protein